ncbi:hypothetical protein GQR58_003945 [Nymphon striatum]|nr:hypothetical protein GQR58_003945 [Nymphon striatum]
MVEELRTASNKVGLEINLSKTKVMLNRNVEIQPIMTGNVALDQVDRYTYLGQLISIHRDWEPEMTIETSPWLTTTNTVSSTQNLTTRTIQETTKMTVVQSSTDGSSTISSLNSTEEPLLPITELLPITTESPTMNSSTISPQASTALQTNESTTIKRIVQETAISSLNSTNESLFPITEPLPITTESSTRKSTTLSPQASTDSQTNESTTTTTITVQETTRMTAVQSSTTLLPITEPLPITTESYTGKSSTIFPQASTDSQSNESSTTTRTVQETSQMTVVQSSTNGSSTISSLHSTEESILPITESLPITINTESSTGNSSTVSPQASTDSQSNESSTTTRTVQETTRMPVVQSSTTGSSTISSLHSTEESNLPITESLPITINTESSTGNSSTASPQASTDSQSNESSTTTRTVQETTRMPVVQTSTNGSSTISSLHSTGEPILPITESLPITTESSTGNSSTLSPHASADSQTKEATTTRNVQETTRMTVVQSSTNGSSTISSLHSTEEPLLPITEPLPITTTSSTGNSSTIFPQASTDLQTNESSTNRSSTISSLNSTDEPLLPTAEPLPITTELSTGHSSSISPQTPTDLQSNEASTASRTIQETAIINNIQSSTSGVSAISLPNSTDGYSDVSESSQITLQSLTTQPSTTLPQTTDEPLTNYVSTTPQEMSESPVTSKLSTSHQISITTTMNTQDAIMTTSLVKYTGTTMILEDADTDCDGNGFITANDQVLDSAPHDGIKSYILVTTTKSVRLSYDYYLEHIRKVNFERVKGTEEVRCQAANVQTMNGNCDVEGTFTFPRLGNNRVMLLRRINGNDLGFFKKLFIEKVTAKLWNVHYIICN